MSHLLKKEKKNVFLLSLLLFLVSVLIVNTFQIPLLAGTAYCSDGDCSCSCSGSDCSCVSGNNSCSCYCYPNSHQYCNKSKAGGEPEET